MKTVIFAAALVMGGAAAAQTTTYDPATADPGRIVQPSNANPERDARGILVISDPAVVPAGYNNLGAIGGPMEAEDVAALEAQEPYPACTATVTDNCIQLYERGVSR